MRPNATLKIRYLVYNANSSKLQDSDLVRCFPDADSALEALGEEGVKGAVLYDARLAGDSLPVLPPDYEDYVLLHAGLCLGADQTFQSLWLASTNWLFLDPQPQQRCVSWKATPALCWLRPGIVRALGGFDSAYQTATVQLMDLAYRLLIAGGRICHHPLTTDTPPHLNVLTEIPLVDELIFSLRHVGISATLYTAFWLSLIIKRPWQVARALSSALRRYQMVPPPDPQPNLQGKMHLLNQKKRLRVDSISVIIPTLDRYEYLPKAIKSLLDQTPQADEIIVVDQTPAKKRRPEIYAEFTKYSVRVIYLDRAGQSGARNAGILAAKGEWCLLFDDDSVAWDGLISHHIKAVELSGASVSAGVSLAPGKTYEHIPPRIRYFHTSDVLDTGNCLVKRQALLNVKGLDPVFDHGPGSDMDLGTRLHLNGFDMIFNPYAIRTHYKALKGGMRTYGAWWRHRTTFWGPFPPPTQIYTIQRFYPKRYWIPLYLQYYIKAKHLYNWLEYFWLWFLSPWRLRRAIREATVLKNKISLGFSQPAPNNIESNNNTSA